MQDMERMADCAGLRARLATLCGVAAETSAIKTESNPQLLMAAHALRINPETVRQIVDDWMEQTPREFLWHCSRHQVLQAVKTVHSRCVIQGVYSNYPADVKLEALGVFQCMKTVVWSGDPEVFCPINHRPGGWLVAARNPGVTSSAVIYVGDNPKLDRIGAEAAGMSFTHVDSFAKVWAKCGVENSMTFLDSLSIP